MPIYEYQCNACSCRYERLVFRSQAQVACPRCSSEDTKKLLSSFGLGASSSGSGASPTGSGCGGCTSSSCAGCR